MILYFACRGVNVAMFFCFCFFFFCVMENGMNLLWSAWSWHENSSMCRTNIFSSNQTKSQYTHNFTNQPKNVKLLQVYIYLLFVSIYLLFLYNSHVIFGYVGYLPRFRPWISRQGRYHWEIWSLDGCQRWSWLLSCHEFRQPSVLSFSKLKIWEVEKWHTVELTPNMFPVGVWKVVWANTFFHATFKRFFWGTMRLVDRCIDSVRFTVDSFLPFRYGSAEIYILHVCIKHEPKYNRFISFVWLRERDVFGQMGSPTRARNVQTYRLAHHLNKCGLG